MIPFEDLPATNPNYNFSAYAKSISESIDLNRDSQLTIGIFGGYGTGKTTLMNNIRSKIKEKFKRRKNFFIINFNAWRHEREENLFLPFLYSIKNEVETLNDKTLLEQFKAAIRGIAKGSVIKMDTGIFTYQLNADKAINAEKEYLTDELDSILNGYYNAHAVLRSLTVKKKLRFAIFIDDLDRCHPDLAFELLESLKSLMDIKGYTFILGLDPRAIGTYIEKKYGENFPVTPSEYLDKIIQIRFEIPSLSVDDVSNEISNELQRLIDHGSDEIKEWAIQVKSLLGTGKKEFLPTNIRQMKKLLNSHFLLSSTKGNPYNVELLLYFMILLKGWPKVFWIFGILKNEIVDFLGDQPLNVIDLKSKVDPYHNFNKVEIDQIATDIRSVNIFLTRIHSMTGNKNPIYELYFSTLGWCSNIDFF